MRNPASSCVEVYKKTANDLGISEELVRAVVYNMWNGVKLGIRNGESHGFLIHNFGTFEVFQVTLNNEILRCLRAYKKKKLRYGENETLRKNFEKEFKALWKMRQSAIKTEKDFRLKKKNGSRN